MMPDISTLRFDLVFDTGSKYFRWYHQLILNAKIRVLDTRTYFERHHAIPKALGGTHVAYNLVNLTAREHFIAHALIPRMCLKDHHRKSMNRAITRMSKNCKQSSRIFERERIRVNREGNSEEARRKQSEAQMGRVFTEERKQKLRDAWVRRRAAKAN